MGGGGNNPDFWADLALDVLCSSRIVPAAVFALGCIHFEELGDGVRLNLRHREFAKVDRGGQGGLTDSPDRLDTASAG